MGRTANSDLVLKASVENKASDEFQKITDDVKALEAAEANLQRQAAEARKFSPIDEAAFQRAKTEVKSLDQAMEELAQNSGGLRNRFIEAIAATDLLSKGLELAGRAARAVVDGLIDCTKEALEAEKAERDLATALEFYGASAGASVEHSKALADSIQQSTGVSADAILQMQSMMLTLGVLPENLDAATVAALGWSRATGKDMSAAARDVHKVLEGKLEVLGRMGVRVKSVTEGIEFMSRGWRLLEQDGKSLEGRLRILGENFGDLKEAIGGTVTKSDNAAAAISRVNERVLETQKFFADPEVKQSINTMIGVIDLFASAWLRAELAMAKVVAKMADVVTGFGPLKSGLELIVRAWDAASAKFGTDKPIAFGGPGHQQLLGSGAGDRPIVWTSDEVTEQGDTRAATQERMRAEKAELKRLGDDWDAELKSFEENRKRAAQARAAAAKAQLKEFGDDYVAGVKADLEAKAKATKDAASELVRRNIESLKAQETEAKARGDLKGARRDAASRAAIADDERALRLEEDAARTHFAQMQFLAQNFASGTTTLIGDAFRGEFDRIGEDFAALIERMLLQLVESQLLGFFGKALGIGVGAAAGGPVGIAAGVGLSLAGGALDAGGLGSSTYALTADRTNYAGTSSRALRGDAAQAPPTQTLVINNNNNSIVPPNSAQTHRNIRDGILPALKDLRRRGAF